MKNSINAKNNTKTNSDKRGWVFSDYKKNWQLYVMIFIPLLYIIVFKYFPMYGAQIAFRDYQASKGILGSDWVGLSHFKRFFNSPLCWKLIKNTLMLSIYSLVLSSIFPIVLAIALNYVRSTGLKKAVQLITYLPHFLSTVVIISLMSLLFNSHTGVVSNIAFALTGERINVLGSAGTFRHLYVWSGIWQGVGWGSILYISALAGVNPSLHEAAMIDGANIWRRIQYIDIPCILPTIAIMLVMSMGSILSVGFDKTFLMQNPINLDVSEVLSTYEYKRGIAASIPDYSYPSAIGLVTSVVTFFLVMLSNKISNVLSGYGLW